MLPARSSERTGTGTATLRGRIGSRSRRSPSGSGYGSAGSPAAGCDRDPRRCCCRRDLAGRRSDLYRLQVDQVQSHLVDGWPRGSRSYADSIGRSAPRFSGPHNHFLGRRPDKSRERGVMSPDRTS